MKTNYLFMHIKKTAGMSLFNACKSILGSDNVVYLTEPIDNNKLAVAQKYLLFGGHFSNFSQVKAFKDRYTIAFLREPVDRFLSQYYYYRNNMDKSYDNVVYKSKNLSIEEFISHYEKTTINDVCNKQVLHFIDTYDIHLSKPELLELAKANLQGIDFIGIFEHLLESVYLLSYDCSWDVISDLPMENVTKDRKVADDYDKSLIDKIIQMNELDVQLYNYGLTLYNSKKLKILSECVRQKNLNCFEKSFSGEKASPIMDEGRIFCHTIFSSPKCEINHDFGTREIEISEVRILSKSGNPFLLKTGEFAEIIVSIASSISETSVTCGIKISDFLGQILFGTNSYHLKKNISVKAGDKKFVSFLFKLNLNEGNYRITAALHAGSSHLEHNYHFLENAAEFSVINNSFYFEGNSYLHPIEVKSVGHNRMLNIDRDIIDKSMFGIKVSNVLIERESIICGICINNYSRKYLSSLAEHPVNLSYHLLNSIGTECLVFDGERTSVLPYIEPGKSGIFDIVIKRPEENGKYTIRLTMVQEGVGWFDEYGIFYDVVIDC